LRSLRLIARCCRARFGLNATFPSCRPLSRVSVSLCPFSNPAPTRKQRRKSAFPDACRTEKTKQMPTLRTKTSACPNPHKDGGPWSLPTRLLGTRRVQRQGTYASWYAAYECPMTTTPRALMLYTLPDMPSTPFQKVVTWVSRESGAVGQQAKAAPTRSGRRAALAWWGWNKWHPSTTAWPC